LSNPQRFHLIFIHQAKKGEISMDKEKASYEIFNKIRDEKSRFFDKEENSDKYFDLIKEYMLSEANYDLSLYRDNYLKGRLYHRVRSKKYGNFQAYYITLQQNPREVLALKNILTIHTTEFFRNKSVFR